jgi:ComF family protein
MLSLNKLKKISIWLINLTFPHSCLACNKITANINYTGLCLKCYKQAELFNIKLHPELNSFLSKSYIDSFNALFLYSQEIAKIILQLKFHDQEEKGYILSNLLISKVKQTPNYEQCILIPVPIHPKRLLKRKFNQSTVLAKPISKKLNMTFSNSALKRTINTAHQTGVSRSKRKQQLRNAFLADKNIIQSKDIILIDDVFTTGSTANLCAKELKNKGAKKVHVITIAYTSL